MVLNRPQSPPQPPVTTGSTVTHRHFSHTGTATLSIRPTKVQATQRFTSTIPPSVTAL
ncbi:hypothetical protein [Kamptonema formosum]|uniref:hypothetical protein n=1 Tax=Kamptonema formosum TaxID=331992 RepID=UPI0012DEB95B|nr:hypothetical protein [Oscillatoria sp. PCC 10802]